MKNPETDKKKIVSDENNSSYDFTELITTIVDYYCFKGQFFPEDGEEWKEKANLKPKFVIPDKMDEKIERAFIKQLEKFEG